MAVPVQFQNFKSAGIYRVVYDKSAVLGTEAELLRLVVGYSPKGPFNTPVYIKSTTDFRDMFGDISTSLEKRGCFFHRSALQALNSGPILCLNLKPFTDEVVDIYSIGDNISKGTKNVRDIYDTSRFWKLEPDKLNDDLDASDKQYMHIANTDSIETSCTFVIRKPNADKLKDYNITVEDWYKNANEDVPEYLSECRSKKISDFFTEIYVFKGKFTTDIVAGSSIEKYFVFEPPVYTEDEIVEIDGKTYDKSTCDPIYEEGYLGDDNHIISYEVNEYSVEAKVGDYKLDYISYNTGYDLSFDGKNYIDGTKLYIRDTIETAFGDEIDALDALYYDTASGAIGHYIGCMLPNFLDYNSGYKAIDLLFNSDSDAHHLMMSLDENWLIDLNPSEVWDTIFANSAALKYNSKTLNLPKLNSEGDPIETVEVLAHDHYYAQGYTYLNSKPKDASIDAKFEWQQLILNTLSEEKGLLTGLLSQAEIEYRYIVDTFESYYNGNPNYELKSQLALLAKEKQLCLSLLNFPAVRTLLRQDETMFTNSKNLFDVNKVVKLIKLPSEANGASFCGFYTPLKFSDGYVDTIVPSAALVSNLFIEKYKGRFPYSIVAGPNYANIQYANLVGPDYHYSQDELHVMEPYGVNCMVYRPTFGTFVNSNQTAKQYPKSALSSINVRELVIYLQEEIGKVLQSFQWEFNNPTTRSAIKSKADIICERAKQNGGIQAYLNIMDESNNTPDIIDNEMCVLSTHIEPGRGMGKMVHELTIYRTGGLQSLVREG